MVQHVLLARQLNQPAQHLPLKGLSPQQQSQVLSQYNHDQQRSTAPMQAMVGFHPLSLLASSVPELPSHLLLQLLLLEWAVLQLGASCFNLGMHVAANPCM